MTTPSPRAMSIGSKRAASRSTGSTRAGEDSRDSVGSIGAAISGYGARDTRGVSLARARMSASSGCPIRPSRTRVVASDSPVPRCAIASCTCASFMTRLPRSSSTTRRPSGRSAPSCWRAVSTDAPARTARSNSSDGASFGMNAVAPAASARSRIPGSRARKTMAVLGSSCVIFLATSRPLWPGIESSRTIRSGRRVRAIASAVDPSPASPTTVISRSAASSARTPSRTA